MKKILQLSLVFLLFLSHKGYSQDRTITGTVTSAEDGSVLPGVTVAVKDKVPAIGTVTDAEGKFSIGVPSDAEVLVFTYIGMVNQEVSIGTKSTINVSLAPNRQELGEVVVTALNISREKQSLGYSTQSIGGEEVTKAKQQNFINSMSGKVAGVQIRTNANFGGSTNIVIRGNKSITGSNQPLFVVDGVPIDNSTGNLTSQQSGRTGYDYGNAAADINPEDIETINILKGAAASALYGSRAANGVVMITTKKGTKRKGIGVSFSSSTTASRINKNTFMKYQDEYGAGYGPYYDSPYFFEEDIDGDGVVDLIVPTTEDGSYGGKFDPNLMVYHWDSFVPESPNYQKKYPWTAAKNTPVDFFETQMEYSNTLALSGGSDANTFRLSYTNYKSDWILPNSDMTRHNFNFSGSSKINNKLTASISANYVNNTSKGRGSTGYNDNIMTNFRQWWQTNVDVKSLRDMYMKTGKNYTWNGADYSTPQVPIYWDNPYWTRYQNFQTDNRNRIFGNFSLNYDVTPWLSVLGRVALDNYSELREERRAIGSLPTEFGIPGSSGRQDQSSGYQRIDRRVSEMNYDLILTAKKDLSEDFSLVGVLGSNIRQNKLESIWSATNGGLVVPNLYSLDNSALPTPLPVENDQRKEVYGYFANASLGFKNMVFLEASARNDISSALPVNNNSYFYHSEALSFVFSKLVKVPFLDFGKVRINYAEVGNDTDANRTRPQFSRFENFGATVLYSFPTIVNNSLLEPERTKSLELGLELRGLNNRANATLDLYNTNSVDQIVEVEISKAVGYGFKYLNGGNIQNRGIELSLGYDILKTGSLTWNTTVNWSLNRSKVISLPADIENYVINSYQGGISTNATVKEPYGVMRGTGYQFLNGERVIDENGYYVAVADRIIGDPNPKWNGGLLNTVSYKGLVFSFLIDMQKGGDVWSLDTHYGQSTGLPYYTAGLNELGNPKRDPIADGGGILFDGVQADGSKNTIRVEADTYAGGFYWGDQTTNPSSMTMYDASYVKLREMSLGYTIPKAILGNVFQSASLSVIGRNLWIIHKKLPFADPESGLGAGNGQGYISGAYPTTRSLGVKLDVSF